MSLEQLIFGVGVFIGGVDYVGLFCFVFLVMEESNHALGGMSSLFWAFILQEVHS